MYPLQKRIEAGSSRIRGHILGIGSRGGGTCTGDTPASLHDGSRPSLLSDVLKEKIHDVRYTWRVGDDGEPVSAASHLDPAMSS